MFANIAAVTYEIGYFHPRVLAELESWPVDVLADYAHLVELLAEYGPNLRLPHSRAMGDVFLNFVLGEGLVLGELSTASWSANASWSFTPS